MAKPKNENNVYELVCRVTQKETPTNPKQVRDLVARYGITQDELKNSYVSRAGRNVLASEKLSVEQAVEKYGIHLNVANKLKALRAPVVKTPRVKKVKPAVVETPVETPAPEVEQVAPETPVEPVEPVTEESEAVVVEE
jgi:hypothetical protein